jgi:hypothetical protein
MKHYVTLFEKFEEAFDDFHQKPDTKSDTFYQQIGRELIELANQYCKDPIDIEMFDEKYATATRIKDFENDLIVIVNDQMGEDLAEEFAADADQLLASYELSEKKKAKTENQKLFGKKSKISDNGMVGKTKKEDNLEKPSKMDNMSSLKR